MEFFVKNTIHDLEHLYKINLINSCSGYKSANLISTKSKDGFENLAVFSSLTHIGSNPALLGFFSRPTSVTRNTYNNIKSTGFYAINPIHESILEDAHHTSAKYNTSESEFNFTNLNSEYKHDFFAPFVEGCPIQIAMPFVEEYDIKANNTILVVGKIVGLYIKDYLLEKDGFINLQKGKIATINGLDGYTIPQENIRFGYQRPKS